jgi:hypothetical protein
MDEIENLLKSLRKAREDYKESGEEDPIPVINAEKKLKDATDSAGQSEALKQLYKKYLGE